MDLLDTDQKQAPAAVLALRKLALAAMQPGACTCARCQKSGGDQAGYQQLHSGTVGDRVYSRVFTRATREEVVGAFERAWEAQYLVKVVRGDQVELDSIEQLGQRQTAARVVALAITLGIVRPAAEGGWRFA